MSDCSRLELASFTLCDGSLVYYDMTSDFCPEFIGRRFLDPDVGLVRCANPTLRQHARAKYVLLYVDISRA